MAQGKVCLAADVSVVAMTPDLGAEVRGVDLCAPLSDACFARIVEIFHRYGVIYLREQALDARLLARFAARFGEAEPTPSDEHALPGLPQVGVLVDSTRTAGHARPEPSYWHSDRSHDATPPAATLLYAVNGADTGSIEFVNMYAVFSALAPEKQLLVQKLRGLHVALSPEPHAGVEANTAQRRGTEHPLVRIHPETGKRALYLAKEVVVRAAGLREEDSRKLIEQLEAFATQPRFVYAHRWRKGDLLIWDNRCTLHRMLSHGSDRTLYRIRVRGEEPIAG